MNNLIQDGQLGPQPKHLEGLKTLIFELEETLIHRHIEPIGNPLCVIPVSIDGNNLKIYIQPRPFVKEFLEECFHHFEMVIFTQGNKSVAD